MNRRFLKKKILYNNKYTYSDIFYRINYIFSNFKLMSEDYNFKPAVLCKETMTMYVIRFI